MKGLDETDPKHGRKDKDYKGLGWRCHRWYKVICHK